MERVAVGLGVRDELVEPLLSLVDRSVVDVLEVMIDDALDPGPRRAGWRKLGARWTLVAHGTELGVASADGPSPVYVGRVAAALADVHALWYSEHLAYLAAGGVELGHFAPLSSTDAAFEVLADNVRAVSDRCACPFLLENPADVLGWESEGGGAALGRSFARALVAARTGALLDLTNLVLGARNDGYDPMDFIGAIDLDRVVEVHLAGGRFDGKLWIDSHDHDVDDEALALLPIVAKAAPKLRAVVIERDERLPSLASLLEEVAEVRGALRSVGRS